MTALRKDGGGVRRIVAGEVIRRVTARTIAQQLGEAVGAFQQLRFTARIVNSVRVHRARASDVDGAGSRGDSDVK